jgi:hypothetical protein
MKLCCFVSALPLAFVVLLPDGCLHVHEGLIWCEIYILAHHNAELIYIDKHKRDLSKGGPHTCDNVPCPDEPYIKDCLYYFTLSNARRF